MGPSIKIMHILFYFSPTIYYWHDICFVINFHRSVTAPTKTILLFLKAVSGLSAHHSEASPNAALDLSGCACCQSVRMNLSPVLTEADEDAQRKRNGAGKTRFCVSGPHVMRSVGPPKLVWICHQLECQSFREVDFGVERFEWINGLYYLFFAKTNGFFFVSVEFSVLSAQFCFWRQLQKHFHLLLSENNMEWWTEQIQMGVLFLPPCFEGSHKLSCQLMSGRLESGRFPDTQRKQQ